MGHSWAHLGVLLAPHLKACSGAANDVDLVPERFAFARGHVCGDRDAGDVFEKLKVGAD